MKLEQKRHSHLKETQQLLDLRFGHPVIQVMPSSRSLETAEMMESRVEKDHRGKDL